ncbi:IPT/TIG domain-containing protein [Eleftheria terrae]|uniref:IPT/TIG domain-containing protein n=1 Tax=Eleftheria terrae TaxID=1597781 RepID=UPI00263BC52C|nr:IPT/TIG domain-containing protein [Eleftheria terrae]WKB55283.1 IPT/TIG domain-containing protein [Eleftheria terrae]
MAALVVLLLMLLAVPHAAAQTRVSGAIQVHTRWSLEGSPYLLEGPVSVQGGATLSIDAGVVLYMGAGSQLEVQAGAVRATGTAAAPIRVLSDKTRLGQPAAPGDWGQWVFTSGASASRLDHVVFEHGRGLVVLGASPVFNHLAIRHQQGAAITVDLAASPSGIGNQASDNSLNGIAVPAGDITGTVKWGLRGIPYVVASGTVSVGASPVISGISPASVEQGQTVTLSVSGSRLQGAGAASFDQAGLALTPFSGGSASQVHFQLKVDAAAPLGTAGLRLQTDAGEVTLDKALTVTPPLPVVTALSPNSILAGAGLTRLSVQGRNFGSQSQVLLDATVVPTEYVSAAELRATVPSQSAPGTLRAQVRSPDPRSPGQYLTSNSELLTVEAPVPPTVNIEPNPIALPPDGKPRQITVRFSKADYRDHTLVFSTSDPGKASVEPSRLTIAAGQTSGKLTIVSKLAGSVTLTGESETLARISVPVFITTDFRGASTSFARPVGVFVEGGGVVSTSPVTVTHSSVGVSVGAVLTGSAPRGWALGSRASFTVSGRGIPAGARVALVPSAGLTLDSPVVSPDGSQLQFTVSAAADAPTGAKRIEVRDAAGALLAFSDPAQSMVQLMSGLPTIVSVAPIDAVPGSTVRLVVRGQHLHQGLSSLQPADGLVLDAQPQVNADGTELTASLQVLPGAPTGVRLVRVATPAGQSTAEGSEANRLRIVSALRETVTPVASRLVGVVVGQATRPPEPQSMAQHTVLVGVLRGVGVAEVAPTSAVIGTSVTVEVRGVGLRGITSVALQPATGLTIEGSPSINDEGTLLRFVVKVDAAAELGLRRLVLNSAAGPVAFARASDGSFLVSAPVPELDSVEPQVLLAGQASAKVTLRGRNLGNVVGVRLVPADGVSVSGPFESSADNTVLSFTASVGGAAPSSTRTVIVATAAGESSPAATPANTLRIAKQAGPTYSALVAPQVGVLVGRVATQDPVATQVMATSVGVVIPLQQEPVTTPRTGTSTRVGLVVGEVVRSMTPDGWLQGASGEVVVTGSGLDAVTAAAALPPTGLLFGTPVVEDQGRRLRIPLSVAPDAPLVQRRLQLLTAGGTLTFVLPETPVFGIGRLPSMSSVSPIVLEQGKAVRLTVRGTALQGVARVGLEPADGVAEVSAPEWSQDALGELLTVTVQLDAAATLGQRALRLFVPGGATPAAASAINTVKVVGPQ